MAILGILSIFQAWFIPGFICLLFFKHIKFLDKIILSVPSSLVINYIIVYSLVSLKFYTKEILLIIIFVEIIFGIIFINKEYKWDFLIIRINNLISFRNTNKNLIINLSSLNLIIFLIFIIYAALLVQNLGLPISVGDPANMWNKWAILWSENIVPTEVEYPQSVPILYSIPYQLIGNYEIEYFTRAICFIYPIWIFIIFFRLINIFPEKKIFFKISLIITTLYLLSILRNYALYVGYSDTFLVLGSTTVLFLILNKDLYQIENSPTNKKNILNFIFISLIASAPALTKQMGLMISFLFPIFYMIHNFSKKENLSKIVFITYATIFILCLSWYIHPFSNYIKVNFQSTYFGGLSADSVNNRSSIELLLYGLHYAFWYLKYIIIFLALISVKDRLCRYFVLLIILPYFLIWSLFFVADNRNLLMISPFLGYVVAFGFLHLIEILKMVNFHNFKYLKILFIILCSVTILVGILVIKNDERLVEKSIELKKIRGQRDINALLYNYFENQKPKLKILSIENNQFVHLPIIGNMVQRSNCKDLKNKLEINISNEHFYVLIENDLCKIKQIKETYKYIYNFEKIFNFKKYSFYLIKF